MTTAMGSRSSLPTPGELSNSDFLGPPSLFWSAWLELGGAINKVLVLRLNTNSAYCCNIFQLEAALDQLPAVYPSNTFLQFSLSQ